MDHLDHRFEIALKEIFNPDEMILNLISGKFMGLGMDLNKKQLSEIKSQLRNEPLGNFHLEITDDQVEHLKRAGHDPQNLNLDFSNIDTERMKQELQKIINDFVLQVSATYGDALLANWRKQSNKTLGRERKLSVRVSKKIKALWGYSLKSLEMLLSISRELGADFNHIYRPDAVKNNDLIFEVLTLSHGRACKIGYEILSLISNGFADGAYARWRTLYEITVTSAFIAKYGQDVAQRYLDYKFISDFKEATSYQNNCKSLGLDPLPDDVFTNIKNKKDEMVNRYGKKFFQDNGWAQLVLKKKPGFIDIESAVDLNHIHPFYVTSNTNVHAGSDGILSRLGLQNDQRNILAGPSVFGLAEVGRNTAFSFSLLTGILLLSKPNLDRLAYVKALEKLRNDTCWAFDEVAKSQVK